VTEPLVALYVPGDRPDRFDKAVRSGADVVIVDLEDAVAESAKDRARGHVCQWLAQRVDPRPAIQVRINSLQCAAGRDDLAALPPSVEIRVPKVSSPEDLEPLADRTVHALIENAAGVENAFGIARHPAVRTLSLGEADLRAELGITDDQGLNWIRTRVVVAARAAGLPAPMMSVYPAIRDLDGLARSCVAGRGLGMRGRTAVHPCQIETIRRSFAPSGEQQRWAAQVLAALEDAQGVATLADGTMVDEAMARAARQIAEHR
jgi:citrate lyase subunit beta/citryl-CoA lyase